jgi:hypothetical protein
MRRKINTPERFTEARVKLGLDKTALAAALRLAPASGRQTIRRIEEGQNTGGVPGPMQIAMEAFLAGHRPVGVRFPCDEAAK